MWDAARTRLHVVASCWDAWRAYCMMLTVAALEEIFSVIAQSGARYLVVGGVAVVLHGHPRFTADLDLAVQLDRDNVLRLITALKELDYRPRAPVEAEALADASTRESWIRDKGLVVFSLHSPRFPATEIDLFVEEPFDFDEAYGRAFRADMNGTIVPVASIADLIAIKRVAGRTRDLEDIAALEAIQKELDEEG